MGLAGAEAGVVGREGEARAMGSLQDRVTGKQKNTEGQSRAGEMGKTDWVRKARDVVMWRDTEMEVGRIGDGRVTEADRKRR